LIAIFVMAWVVNRTGKELEDDPEYQKRLAEKYIEAGSNMSEEKQPGPNTHKSALIFLAAL
jgi:anaerobic C4-dicarboxylate transporter